jgi:hypothetical protein
MYQLDRLRASARLKDGMVVLVVTHYCMMLGKNFMLRSSPDVKCHFTVGWCIVDVYFSVRFSFPEPLSTLIPIRDRAVIMPASAPRSPATSKSKQQRTPSKRKANDDPTKDEHVRKRPNVEPESNVDVANGRSEEALFKIRYAAEFDTDLVEDNNQVQVKQEQQDDEILLGSPMRLRSATRTPRCTPRRTKLISVALRPLVG